MKREKYFSKNCSHVNTCAGRLLYNSSNIKLKKWYMCVWGTQSPTSFYWNWVLYVVSHQYNPSITSPYLPLIIEAQSQWCGTLLWLRKTFVLMSNKIYPAWFRCVFSSLLVFSFFFILTTLFNHNYQYNTEN